MESHTPLLTPQEWANWRRARRSGEISTLETMLSLLIRARRWAAIAALALDGQPEGFTMDDISDVVVAAGDERHIALRSLGGVPSAADLALRLDAIAARLAQLRAPD